VTDTNEASPKKKIKWNTHKFKVVWCLKDWL